MGLISTFKNLKTFVGSFSSSEKFRMGTKITVYWLIFSAVLIVWLVVGIPIVCIFYPNLTEFAPHISSIILALIGGSTVAFTTSETRKTIENVKNVKRPTAEESPLNPFEK